MVPNMLVCLINYLVMYPATSFPKTSLDISLLTFFTPFLSDGVIDAFEAEILKIFYYF